MILMEHSCYYCTLSSFKSGDLNMPTYINVSKLIDCNVYVEQIDN